MRIEHVTSVKKKYYWVSYDGEILIQDMSKEHLLNSIRVLYSVFFKERVSEPHKLLARIDILNKELMRRVASSEGSMFFTNYKNIFNEEFL